MVNLVYYYHHYQLEAPREFRPPPRCCSSWIESKHILEPCKFWNQPTRANSISLSLFCFVFLSTWTHYTGLNAHAVGFRANDTLQNLIGGSKDRLQEQGNCTPIAPSTLANALEHLVSLSGGIGNMAALSHLSRRNAPHQHVHSSLALNSYRPTRPASPSDGPKHPPPLPHHVWSGGRNAAGPPQGGRASPRRHRLGLHLWRDKSKTRKKVPVLLKFRRTSLSFCPSVFRGGRGRPWNSGALEIPFLASVRWMEKSILLKYLWNIDEDRNDEQSAGDRKEIKHITALRDIKLINVTNHNI